MPDSWHTDHAAALSVAQRIGETVEKRNNISRLDSQYSKYDNEIRVKMKEFANVVSDLRRTHIKNSQSFYLTRSEVDRRQGMLEELQTKEKQLEQLINGNSTRPSGFDYDQFSARSSANPWADEEDIANNMDVSEIRQHQQTLVREQDDGLGILSQVIQRQKNMAVDIGNEIDRQDGLLDDIQENVDRTDSRVREETQHVRTITLKENRGNCAHGY
ncbi:STX8 [Bugula neritina]|uniref:STX8 n=1 Tax=Bugula neritina TaxID=10212 RepID=A0A7J7K0F9_BUGNE|nr:STX8 [Bugula neritina]